MITPLCYPAVGRKGIMKCLAIFQDPMLRAALVGAWEANNQQTPPDAALAGWKRCGASTQQLKYFFRKHKEGQQKKNKKKKQTGTKCARHK